MEIGIDAEMPTYSGGLGVLAGDTIRSAAELNLPMVALTLLHRKGYFYQWISADGRQTEEPVEWVVDDYMQEMQERASVTIDGRTVVIRPWKCEVKGVGGFTVPVYFPDTNLPENVEWGGMGQNADRFSLWRRSAPPALPGSHSRDRRGSDPPLVGVRPNQAFSHE